MAYDEADEIVASVPRALAESARTAVAEGRYASLDAVVSAALDLWIVEDRQSELDVERLRALYDEGLASGAPVPFDRKSLEARLTDRIAARRRA